MRLSVGDGGTLRLGRGAGRGAYLCADATCAERALRSGALPRRLRAAVRIPDGLPGLVAAALPEGRNRPD